MNRLLIFLTCTAMTLLPALGALPKGELVRFPAGVKHDAWDALLKKYVNEQGLIAYGNWKANTGDVKALDAYLAQFAPRADKPATGDDLAASGINAYNAFAVRWILQHYPIESIQAIPGSFEAKAHEVGGVKIALNDIEHGTLRPAIGYRAHAALVCCARSCPPLQRTAYTAAHLDAQIDDAYRAWLAREDLNQFSPEKKEARVSSIFKWFHDDFEKAGGVQKVLASHAPERDRAFLAGGDCKLDYLPYRWGLNDQGGQGKDYSKGSLIWDKLTEKLK